jgi:hypothetical protein
MHGIVNMGYPVILLYVLGTVVDVYMIAPVYERENKLRSMLHLSGMSCTAYQLGNFVADYLLTIVNVFLLLLLT